MIRVNLIPEGVRLAKTRRRRVRRWSLAAAAAIIAVLLPLAAEALQYNKIRTLRGHNGRLRAELQRVRDELASVTSEADRTLVHVEHSEALRSKRAWSGLLAGIGSSMPPRCWLTSLSTEPPVPPAGTAKPVVAAGGQENTKRAAMHMEAPRKLRLSGYALDAAMPHSIVKNLKETNLFTHVSLSRASREPALDGMYFKFEMECEW